MMDYQSIKDEAKEQGISIKDLCALSPGNDPYYVGRPAQIAQAEWFADQWQALGYSSGIHLRRMHYALVSQKPLVARHDSIELIQYSPTEWSAKGHRFSVGQRIAVGEGEDRVTGEIVSINGARLTISFDRSPPAGTIRAYMVYANTQRCWDYLCSAGKYARYLNLLSPDQFIDKRNFAPEEYYDSYANWPEVRTAISGMYEVENISLPDCPDAPDYDVRGISGYGVDGQPFMLEIWVEKTTMHDVILPLAQRYKINVVAGKGELSISTVREFLKRAKKKGRPVRILYVADYDPAGIGMPISVARKIEFYLSNDKVYADLDIRLQPVVLTAEQIAKYDLPRTPVKDSDKRKQSFELAHGAGQVELDALEALYPGELTRILEDAILQYFDTGLAGRLQVAHDAYRSTLTGQRDDVLIDFPEVAELQARYSQLAENFSAAMEGLQAEMEAAWHVVSTRLGAQLNVIESPTIPTAELDAEPEEQLYQSDREYHDQLASYKAWRDGS